MATQYSRLQLKVHAPLKIKDLTFKVTLTNSATKKTVFSYEGAFDKNGFTKWIHIFQPNRSLIYEVLYRGDVIQRISAKAYPNMNNWSFFDFKTTSELTKKVKENIKEIHLNDGEVAWYLIKKPETVLAWSNRVFKKPLAPSDWDTLRANNPHLSSLVSVGILKPGWIIILSNSTTAKALPEYKKHAKAAFKNLEEMQKDKNFDALFFAQNYEFFYDAILSKQAKVTTENIFENNEHPLVQKFESDSNDSLFGWKDARSIAIDGALSFSEGAITRIYRIHGELGMKMAEEKAKGTKLANAKNFRAFRQKYSTLYNDLNRASMKRLFRWDQSIKTDNMRRIINGSSLARGKNYKGGLKEYTNKMREVSKVIKRVKLGGYFFLAFDIYNANDAINNAKPEDKERTTVVETSQIVGGLGGGAAGAFIVITLASGGTSLIVVGVAAGVSALLGWGGSKIAKWGAGEIYDEIESNRNSQ